ncbi:MAG: hypothetical protein AB1553_13180 [Nitrospirota bacterium]
MGKRLVIGLLVLLIIGTASMAYGVSGYLSSFNATYGTAGTAIASCSLCHTSPPDLNPYGDAYVNSGYSFRGIEGQDSDGDGFTNIAEITARTFPGNAASKPAPVDTTAPIVTGFTVPATANTLTVSVSMTATDNVGVTGYLVNESATAPAAGAAGWSATAPTSYTFATAGTKTLYAWAKDAAGNVSASRSGSVTITLSTADTTAPTVTGFSIPATATTLTVSISGFAATDNVGVTGYMVTESATAPAASAAGWSTTAPASYTFGTPGTKTLYAWAKDAAGNVSASRSGSVTITIATADMAAPTVTVFTIPATSTSLTVAISMSATDNVGVTGYMVSESATAPAANAAGWKATAPTSYTFATAGSKTLYAWAKDAAGNVSASRSASVTITQSDSTADIFPVIADQYGSVYSYAPVATPVLNTKFDDSKPLGVGPVATGGTTFNATVRTGAFTNPVDVYIVLQSHSGDPLNIYVMRPDKTFVPASDGKLVPWKKGIKGTINESLFGSIPISRMQQGRYMIGLLITPSGTLKDYHYWMTGFDIPGEGKNRDGDDGERYRGRLRIRDLPKRTGGSYIYKPVDMPVLNTDTDDAMPIGIGALADGGTTLNITIGTARFNRLTDLYVTLYMPASDPFNMYVMKPDKTFIPVSKFMVRGDDDDEAELRGIEPWKSRVTGPVNESLFGTLSTSEVPGGVYRLGLLATPAGKIVRYSYWLTSFWVE